jgi:hypothetical protein
MAWIGDVWTRRHRGDEGDDTDIIVTITETSSGLFQIEASRIEEPTVWSYSAASLPEAMRHADRCVVETFEHLCREGCTNWKRVTKGYA